MSLEAKTKVIDGSTFVVTSMLAWEQFKLLPRLGKALGPALAQVVQSAKAGEGLANVDVGAIADAIKSLFVDLNGDELEGITKKLMYNATVDGEDFLKSFNVSMSGRMPTLMKLLYFAFEVNYGNFFDAAREFVAERAAVAKASKTSSILQPVGLAQG